VSGARTTRDAGAHQYVPTALPASSFSGRMLAPLAELGFRALSPSAARGAAELPAERGGKAGAISEGC